MMVKESSGKVEKAWEPRRLLKIRQVAELFNCSQGTVRQLIWGGRLPFVAVGSRHFVEYADACAYIEANKRQHGGRADAAD